MKEGEVLAKKYTQTKDGWFQVTEDTTEQDIENIIQSVNEMIDTDQEYEAFQKYSNIADGPNVVVKTEPEPEPTDEDLEAMIQAFNAIDGIKERKPRRKTDKKQSPKKIKKTDEDDWMRQAEKDALWASLIILGVVALLAGVMALVIWLTPVTMQSIAEWIVIAIVKVLMWFFNLFYKGCVWLFESILRWCGGSF